MLAPELAAHAERPAPVRTRPERAGVLPPAPRDREARTGGWVLALVVALLLGLGLPWWQGERAAARHPVTATDLAAGRAALDRVAVRDGPAPGGYARELFGDGWVDVDGNGCGTRDDVLVRDLAGAVVDDDGCVVLAGTLDDPYTGAVVAFARGERSADVQVDHVVALADAWRSGAQASTTPARTAFANDPANLLAVDGPANQDKGASDASAWLPPEVGYRCVYALRQLRVKDAYGLSVTPAERDALDDALDGCVVVPA